MSEVMVWILLAGFLGCYFLLSSFSLVSYTAFIYLPAYSILGIVISGKGIFKESKTIFRIVNIVAFLIFAASLIFHMAVYQVINVD
ncbi:hypothetical protein [Halobacillus mangrovi]|uniref:hypothetical protein n=1 Tax=Halobacillus mangrovi TaxID=402384 RepID=UPI003D98A7E5